MAVFMRNVQRTKSLEAENRTGGGPGGEKGEMGVTA